MDERPDFISDDDWRIHLDWLKKQKKKPPEEPPLESYDFSEWDDLPVPEQQWTLDNKIPRRQVCLFSGEGAAGKSTIGLHLAAAHVLGRDCLHSLAVPGPAFFIDAEDEISVIHRRLAAVVKHYEASFSDLFRDGLYLFPLAGKDAVMGRPGKGGVILPTHLYNEVLRLAVELKPQTIVIASSANVYAGSEIDRPQVTQFIGLLTRLALASDGSVVLISHPSLTGISSGTGISGSTQWHNAVRARLLITTVKPDNDHEPPADALRVIECKKNQYGPPSDRITLKWRDGMFLPEQGPSSLNKAIREAQADDVLQTCLAQCEREGTIVSATPKSNNYAPHVFAQMEPAVKFKLTKPELAEALTKALANASIHIAKYGKPHRPQYKIVRGRIGDASGTQGDA